MAKFINEQEMINQNAFKFEEKLSSQYTRFLETPPVFVTYFTVNLVETTADSGFNNVEQILGSNSPIRFNKINDLPVYGLERIETTLQEDEEGLDISFESELVILPGTVSPKPHDFFIYNHLDVAYLFMVNEIRYDTIRSNEGYYKISYSLKTFNKEGLSNLQKQTSEEFNCIFKNIGTEDKCLIRSDEYDKLKQFEKLYSDIIERYLLLFYHDRTNTLLCKDVFFSIYDRYITHFIMKNRLFQNKDDYKTIALSIEDSDRLFPVLYDSSILRVFEKRDINKLPDMCKCTVINIEDGESVFNIFRMPNIQSLRFIDGINIGKDYIPEMLLRKIKTNSLLEDIFPQPLDDRKIDVQRLSPIYRIFVKYFNKDNNSLYNDDINDIDISDIGYTFESFILTPILLFIMNKAYSEFIVK